MAEVLEVLDYSIATPWEKLISDIEEIVRGWLKGSLHDAKVVDSSALEDGEGSGGGRGSGKEAARAKFKKIASQVVQYEKQYLTLCCYDTTALVEDDLGGSHLAVSRLESSTDPAAQFTSSRHPISRWFGCSRAVVLEPFADGGITSSESSSLLSALCIALDACHSPSSLPVFIHIADHPLHDTWGEGRNRGSDEDVDAADGGMWMSSSLALSSSLGVHHADLGAYAGYQISSPSTVTRYWSRCFRPMPPFCSCFTEIVRVFCDCLHPFPTTQTVENEATVQEGNRLPESGVLEVVVRYTYVITEWDTWQWGSIMKKFRQRLDWGSDYDPTGALEVTATWMCPRISPEEVRRAPGGKALFYAHPLRTSRASYAEVS